MYCPVEVGDIVNVELPFSEVIMHLQLAGQIRPIKLLEDGMAQIFDEDMNKVSFPVLYSEAGVYHNGETFYVYTNGEV